MEGLSQLILPLLLAAVAGYLLGSISSSILLTRLFTDKQDIRAHGSGNAGMTNVLRTVGKKAAILTFLGDFLKCSVAVTLGWFIVSPVVAQAGLAPELANAGKYCAGLACMLGHIYPLYFGFRGGKGVVTAAAMIALLDWRVWLVVMVIFGLVFLSRHIISLASICAAASYPLITFLFTFFFDYAGSPLPVHGNVSATYLVLVTAAAVLIGGFLIFLHRANIKRLKNGEEKPIISAKK